MHTFKRQTYSGQVVEFIKRCILDGELAPGEQVKEVILSERLGISRAPIREALQILTQDGLITSEPQKGKYIRKMTRQEIENEYEIGGILEGAGVAAALPLMNHVDIARLSGMIEHMARLAPRVGGLYEFTEVDDAFHSALLAHCANRRPVPPVRTSPNFCSITIGTSCSLHRNSWIGIGIFSKPCRPGTPPRWKSLSVNTTANRGGGWRSSARDASRRPRGILLLTPDRFSDTVSPDSCFEILSKEQI